MCSEGDKAQDLRNGSFVPYVLLQWSSLTLSQHQGTPSQQCNCFKPLWDASRSLAKSGLCAPSVRMGKRKVACCAMKLSEAESYKPWVTPSRLGEATFLHENCYLQLFITSARSDCQTWWQRWQMTSLGIRGKQNKTLERPQTGHWRKAQPSSTQSCVLLLHFCVQTHVVPATCVGVLLSCLS